MFQQFPQKMSTNSVQLFDKLWLKNVYNSYNGWKIWLKNVYNNNNGWKIWLKNVYNNNNGWEIWIKMFIIATMDGKFG